MNAKPTWLVIMLGMTALAGCFGGGGGDGGDGGDGTDPGSIDETALYDTAVGNDGFLVAGGIASPDIVGLVELDGGDPSAASAQVVDLVQADGAGKDKADMILNVQEEDGRQFQATLRSIITPEDIDASGSFYGGVAQNMQIHGATGVGLSELPETKAYFFISGLARLRIDGATVEGDQPVFISVVKGIRGDDGALLAAADDADLEMHVYFPGRALGAEWAIPGISEDSLFFYFENVGLEQLDPAEAAEVGANLVEPELPNEAPLAVLEVIVGGMVSTNATLEYPTNLTVTLSGNNSTDSDGAIDIYAWEVREYQNNTSITKMDLNESQGASIDVNFTTPGWKLITLRVIDDDFATTENSTLFFVNYHNLFTHTFGASGDPANSVGAGMTCSEPINCQKHQITMEFGAQSATFDYTKTSAGTTTCNGVRLDLYDPADVLLVGADGDLTVTDPNLLAALGAYDLAVWFDQQVACGYSVNTTISYEPVAASETQA